MLTVKVATHGHCFDGLASAALFTRLLQHVHPDKTFRFVYHAAGYGPGQNGVEPKVLDGDMNAILDFRFTNTDKLTWYFDHHVSAFVTDSDRAAYESHREKHSGAAQRMFHDGGYTSCTKLIAHIGERTFGWDPKPVERLVHWADMIDSAAFPSAEMAVSRKEPALKLMTLAEHKGDDAFLAKWVPRLLGAPFDDVAGSPEVESLYAPLGRDHEKYVDLVRRNATERDGVVVVDLTAGLLEVAGKFVTYSLYPESAYSVVVSRSKSKVKLSIGYNPWSNKERRHNIAKICERSGGGGHPVVGAIALAPDQIREGIALANEIAKELAT